MPVVPESVRQQVASRAAGFCEYCRYPEEFSPGRFCVDHIHPRALGGSGELDNLALACRNCNERKQDTVEAPDPASGAVVLLFHPRRDTWGDHFTWSADFSQMVGLTPSGRATIARLYTNHSGVVRQRQVLHELGLHP